LCANADALFDKHLITISETKELIFSFLLDNDSRLKSQLLLMQPIFQPILNEKRMEYIAYHREQFKKLEVIRKTMR
jgi:predicted restriction endonuclease